MAIRFDDELNREIRRVAQNFNKKRLRDIKKKNRAMVPEKVSVKKLKERFSDKSRSQLRKELNLLKSYTEGRQNSLKFASNEGLVSNWEYNYIKSNLGVTKRWYDNEIKELERIIGDKPEYYIRHHERLNTLKTQRETLNLDIRTLDEQDIKAFRRYISKAQRSELTKKRGFRQFLKQLSRTMSQAGVSKNEIENILSKFDTLTVNEFMELYREEDFVEDFYTIVGSPEGKGRYQLMADSKDVKDKIKTLQENIDDMIKRAKDHK